MCRKRPAGGLFFRIHGTFSSQSRGRFSSPAGAIRTPQKWCLLQCPSPGRGDHLMRVNTKQMFVECLQSTNV